MAQPRAYDDPHAQPEEMQIQVTENPDGVTRIDLAGEELSVENHGPTTVDPDADPSAGQATDA